ncbi:putative LOC100569746 [Trichonephila clavipes]|uniref:Putative LOC100569746 n=1 Tax=Trichonephila clavipes TaxID=2585209 RepID=A0A8X6RCJ4_TRICX|nr:putative LOC100569746 [Trichonephila clavipes]
MEKNATPYAPTTQRRINVALFRLATVHDCLPNYLFRFGILESTNSYICEEGNNHDVQELWFQHDGAKCHTARATIDLLKDTFGDRLISRFVPVNWPPRSCDLTPLDYFLWGYVKSLVYADRPQKLDHVEDNIRRVIADIRPQMLEKVIEHWTSRLDYIRASHGSPMPEVIFKMSCHNIIFRIKSIHVNRIIHRCFIAI